MLGLLEEEVDEEDEMSELESSKNSSSVEGRGVGCGG